jgi:hypothetical protein
MTWTANTYKEALAIAWRARTTYAVYGWTVEIVAPLFDGDCYHINLS